MTEKEIEARLAKLEAWQKQPRGPDDPPASAAPLTNSAPYHQRHSDTRQEKAEHAARQKALDDFRKSPAQIALQELEKRLFDVEEKWRTLHGQGGIRVTGTVIEFIDRQSRVDASTSSTGDLQILEEGEEVAATAASIDFVGETITATATGNAVTVTIAELVFRVCIGGSAVDVTMPGVPV